MHVISGYVRYMVTCVGRQAVVSKMRSLVRYYVSYLPMEGLSLGVSREGDGEGSCQTQGGRCKGMQLCCMRQRSAGGYEGLGGGYGSGWMW